MFRGGATAYNAITLPWLVLAHVIRLSVKQERTLLQLSLSLSLSCYSYCRDTHRPVQLVTKRTHAQWVNLFGFSYSSSSFIIFSLFSPVPFPPFLFSILFSIFLPHSIFLTNSSCFLSSFFLLFLLSNCQKILFSLYIFFIFLYFTSITYTVALFRSH